MKTEDLQKHGLTEDQITYVFAENGKDIKKLQDEIKNLTVERDGLIKKAQEAEDTLKKFDGIDPDQVQRELEDWKQRAENAEKDYAAKLEERDFNDALSAKLGEIKFSSNAARKAIEAEIKAAGLKLKNGEILGLNDLMAQLKESDGGAFVTDDEPGQKKAVFTQPMSGKNPSPGAKKPSEMTYSEMCKYLETNPGATIE